MHIQNVQRQNVLTQNVLRQNVLGQNVLGQDVQWTKHIFIFSGYYNTSTLQYIGCYITVCENISVSTNTLHTAQKKG